MYKLSFETEYDVVAWLSEHDSMAHGITHLRRVLEVDQLDAASRQVAEQWLRKFKDVAASSGQSFGVVSRPVPLVTDDSGFVPMPTVGGDSVQPGGFGHSVQPDAFGDSVNAALLDIRKAAQDAAAAAERASAAAVCGARWGQAALLGALLALLAVAIANGPKLLG